MPEVSNSWAEMHEHHDHEKSSNLRHGDHDEPFPLPFFLIFVGYTVILLVDKVIFDTHSLADHGHDDGHGHVEVDDYRKSFVEATHKQIINDSEIDESIRQYLSRADRFAHRVSMQQDRRKRSRGATSRTIHVK